MRREGSAYRVEWTDPALCYYDMHGGVRVKDVRYLPFVLSLGCLILCDVQ